MMRSLFSGVTGLRAHQTKMDVIGNNIANVNTIGFKKSTTTFKDLFSQTSSYSSAPTGDIGGINAQQIGLGVSVGDINIMHTPGAAQYTGNPLDFCIEGDGFFIVRTPEQEVFTRAGNFKLDSEGNLVTADGNFVLGYPTAWKTTEEATEEAADAAGVDPDAADTVYGHYIKNEAPIDEDGDVGDVPYEDGVAYDGTTASLQGIRIDTEIFYQFAVDQTGAVIAQLREDTSEADIVAAMGGAEDGAEDAIIPKGTKIVIGYVALASFTNASGLEKIGGNNYVRSQNSGPVEIGNPGDAGYGKLIGSSQEMSNVDLSQEMVDMIITQRGFQANSRIITVSDTILEELINLKR